MIETDALKGGQPDATARLIGAQRASNQEEALERANELIHLGVVAITVRSDGWLRRYKYTWASIGLDGDIHRNVVRGRGR